ncbi:MAG: tetratricopeptide repeat protein [Myxococcales bacterium]
MAPTPTARTAEQLEADDASKVDAALEALSAEDVRQAEDLLLEVVRNCPREYAYQLEQGDWLAIKFWDQAEFIHYVAFHKARGRDRAVRWIKSAYPRAFFYLGFLKVKLGDHEQALAFLDAGLALEPSNPKLICEKAQALIGLGRFQEALELYRTLERPCEHVTGHELAMSLRGQGYILINQGQLDRAQEAFERSLHLEPHSEVAHSELLVHRAPAARWPALGGISHRRHAQPPVRVRLVRPAAQRVGDRDRGRREHRRALQGVQRGQGSTEVTRRADRAGGRFADASPGVLIEGLFSRRRPCDASRSPP